MAVTITRVSTGIGEQACSDFLEETLLDAMLNAQNTAEVTAGEATGNLIDSLAWNEEPSFDPDSARWQSTFLESLGVEYSTYHEQYTHFMEAAEDSFNSIVSGAYRVILFSYVKTEFRAVALPSGAIVLIPIVTTEYVPKLVRAKSFIKSTHIHSGETNVVDVEYVNGCPYEFLNFTGIWVRKI